MGLFDARHFCLRFGILAVALLAACGAVPDARPIALDSPDAQRVRDALAHWPHADTLVSRRFPFSADVRHGSAHTTAAGTLEYWAPRDFRVTAAGDDGAIVFDGRFNWGGAMILRQRAGLDSEPIEDLLRDMARAFEMPGRLEGLRAGAAKMVLTRTLADAHEYTWIFDRTDGRLVETDVDMGPLDMLRIYYEGYAPEGWPLHLRLVRFARPYEVTFSFTEDRPSATRP
jgi:hypothetical protein